MIFIFHVACAAAAALHGLFFCMESLWWTRPAVRKTFGLTAEQAETTRLLAYNQGFYNLFLALGALWGQVAPARGLPGGREVSAFALACMLGAAVVLFRSRPGSLRGALLQGVPPAVALAALLAS